LKRKRPGPAGHAGGLTAVRWWNIRQVAGTVCHGGIRPRPNSLTASLALEALMVESDIAPRVVKHLDPDVLEQHGAKYTCPQKRRVTRAGCFICLSEADGTGRWLPVFGSTGSGRISLRPSDRTGDAKWRLRDAYWHPGQVWNAPHTAVLAAAKAGHDDGVRRGVTLDALRAIEGDLGQTASF